MSIFKPALALFAASLALAGPAAAQPAAPTPQATGFSVGDLQLTALRDTQFLRPNDGALFNPPGGTEAVGEALKAAGVSADTIALSVDALLVKTGDRVVLIDTGVGGVLQASLAKAGVTPDQVTDILITHTHGDHVGGLVKDGALAFPKATIRMAEAEWDWLKGKEAQAALVKVIADHVQPFAPGAELAPGIAAVDIAGHTPGHSGYRIASGGQTLLDIGDTAHSYVVSLAHPDWNIAFDTDKDAGRAARIATLKALAESGETIFSPHFPYPGVGKVEAKGEGFVWKPMLQGQ